MADDLNPITREEMYLSAAAGESVELPTPITREEMYLYAIAQKGGGGGGGNPNSVQTITGTLDDPWGDVDYDELSEALQSGNATAIIEADATALGFGTITQPVQKTVGINNLYSDGAAIDVSSSNATANTLEWGNTTGNIAKFAIYAGGTITDALAYASLVPTELTIIWHPLPSE